MVWPRPSLSWKHSTSRPASRARRTISSEWYMNALADIDEATASRIAERCGEYQIIINRDRSKNQRFKTN